MFGFGHFGKRLLEGAVGLFALLGFVYVPLGRHTGFEHARAVLSTPAATAAIEDISSSVLGLRRRALELVTGRLSPVAPPVEPTERSPERAGTGPRPTPPKLK